jgi:hypothetical protein
MPKGRANTRYGDTKEGVVKGRFGRERAGQVRGGCTWGDVDPVLLQQTIHAVTEQGAAVMLTRVSGGTAVCIQIWDGDDRYKAYFGNEDDLSSELSALLDEASKTDVE